MVVYKYKKFIDSVLNSELISKISLKMFCILYVCSYPDTNNPAHITCGAKP